MRARGFTLIEVLVTLGVVMLLMVAMLTLLDSTNRISKEQTNLADAQASGRSGVFEISRVVRQARLGQLYYANAVMPWITGGHVVNNAAGTETITDLDGTTHTLRAGTDAIEARGAVYGDTYFFTPGDVSCGGGNCNGTTTEIDITIEQQTPSGIVNFSPTQMPSIATQTTPFLFVVTSAKYQQVTTGSGTGVNVYSTPLYYVGYVDTGGGSGWYSYTAGTGGSFKFHMDASSVSAQRFNATTNTAPLLQQPFSGGVVSDVVFFVDRGAPEPAGSAFAGKYLHPYLAQAVLDPSSPVGSPSYDVQPIADDVEDLQISYGIDGAGTGGTRDGGVDPGSFNTATRDGDEWIFNFAGSSPETLSFQTGPTRIEAFVNTTLPSSQPKPELMLPTLKSVMIGLVIKSHEPDLHWGGEGAWGVRLFDSSATPISDGTITGGTGATAGSHGLPFRRRVQTMAVNLRNYL